MNWSRVLKPAACDVVSSVLAAGAAAQPVASAAAGHENLRVAFEVHVDGKLAAHSGLMKSTDPARLLVVEGLDKAKEMKLITRLHVMLYGDNSYLGEFAYSNWADPALYK